MENRAFTESLDKLKKEREHSASKQVHLQNSLSAKVIEQLEVRLRNQKLESALQAVRRRDDKLAQQEQIEAQFRQQVLAQFSLMVRKYKKCQEDQFITQKKPLIQPEQKLKLKEFRNTGVIVESQVGMLRQETQMQSFNFYDIA